MLTASCTSRPVLIITGGLRKHALKDKTLAVGGFTAQDLMTYPGQTEEAVILSDAGTALQRRFKRSRVLTAEAAWAAAGEPPKKVSRHVPLIIGRRLTPDFIRKTRASGIDYLLWIELLDNTVESSSGQWKSTRTESSSCNCSKKNGAKCSRSSCGSSCGGSCCHTSREVTEYHSSATSTRKLKASYSLLDTVSGKPVWRADATLADSNVSGKTSESSFPAVPATPLPPMESLLMRRMTAAAMTELPK